MSTLEREISIDRYRVYVKEWIPIGEPKAVVIAMHGYCEHILRYDEAFDKLSKNGIKVIGFDQLGHGNTAIFNNNSFGKHNTWLYTMQILDLLIDENCNHIKAKTYLFGHSWGGAVALSYLAERDRLDHIDGVIAACPAIQLGETCLPHPILKFLLPYVAYLFPWFMVEQVADPEFLSTSKEQVQKYINDPKIVKTAQVKMAFDLINIGEYLLNKGYKNIKINKLLMIQGSDDKIVDVNMFNEMVEKLKDNKNINQLEVEIIQGARHELHNEVNADEILDKYIKFILDN